MANDDWLLPPPPKTGQPKRRSATDHAGTPVPTEPKLERPLPRLSFRGPSSDELVALDRALQKLLTKSPIGPPPAPLLPRPSASPPLVKGRVKPTSPPRREKSWLDPIFEELEELEEEPLMPPDPASRPPTPDTPPQNPPSRLDLAAICAVTERPFILKFRSKPSDGDVYVFEGIDTDIDAHEDLAPAPAGTTVQADKLRWQGFSQCPICRVASGEVIKCTTCKRLACAGRVVEQGRGKRQFRCCESCGGSGPIGGLIKAFSGTQRANRTVKNAAEPADNPVDRDAPKQIGNSAIKPITYRG
jgi:hypothetical protein